MLESIENALAVVSLTPTDGVMIVVGTLLIFALHRIMARRVFAPILEHVEQRESVTTGAQLAAAQMRQKTEALRARFNEAIFRARVEGNAKKVEIVNAAKDQASRIVREAENEVARELQVGREALAKQLEQAGAAAEAQAQELSGRLAAQVDTQLAS